MCRGILLSGEEVLMEYVLAGCSEGGDGTAVEAVDQGDDGGSVLAVLVDGVFSGSLDGAFIGFSAGVGEEYVLHACLFAERLCQVCLGHGVEKVGYMVQGMELLGDGFDPGFIGNAEDVDADAGAHVDVFFAFVVIEVGSFSLTKHTGYLL